MFNRCKNKYIELLPFLTDKLRICKIIPLLKYILRHFYWQIWSTFKRGYDFRNRRIRFREPVARIVHFTLYYRKSSNELIRSRWQRHRCNNRRLKGRVVEFPKLIRVRIIGKREIKWNILSGTILATLPWARVSEIVRFPETRKHPTRKDGAWTLINRAPLGFYDRALIILNRSIKSAAVSLVWKIVSRRLTIESVGRSARRRD